MPAAARGLQGYKAKSFRQKFEQGPENLLSKSLATFADDGNAKMTAIVSNLELEKIFSKFEMTSGLRTKKTAIISFNAPLEFIKAIPEHGFSVKYSFTRLGVDYTTPWWPQSHT